MSETFAGFAPEVPDDEIIEGLEEQFEQPFGADQLTWNANKELLPDAGKWTTTGTVRDNKTDTGQDD